MSLRTSADLRTIYRAASGGAVDKVIDILFGYSQDALECFGDETSIMALAIDEVAERVLTLGATPKHTHEEYLATSKVPVVRDVTDGAEALKHCVAAFSVILLRERTLLHLSGEAGDEGTNALMSDYIREQEKTSWMLRAYLA